MKILRAATLLLACLCAAPASAVSVALSYEIVGGSDPRDPGPGSFLVITLTGDTTGAPAGNAAFAAVTYGSGFLASTGPATQTPIVSTFGFVSWVASNPACLASACTVFNQITLSPLVPDTNPVIGSVKLHVSAIGLIGSTIAVVPETFDFFGAPPPDPVVVTVVPEPGTAWLLGLGLLGLARRP